MCASGSVRDQLDLHADRAVVDRLLLAAARGDRTAFGMLFDRTAPVVLGYLRRRLGRAAAERAAESIYVRLWRIAPRVAGGTGSAHAQLEMLTRAELTMRVVSRPDGAAAGPRLWP